MIQERGFGVTRSTGVWQILAQAPETAMGTVVSRAMGCNSDFCYRCCRSGGTKPAAQVRQLGKSAKQARHKP